MRTVGCGRDQNRHGCREIATVWHAFDMYGAIVPPARLARSCAPQCVNNSESIFIT
jgi:hypothetical protein